jgi:hypothetical protein
MERAAGFGEKSIERWPETLIQKARGGCARRDQPADESGPMSAGDLRPRKERLMTRKHVSLTILPRYARLLLLNRS